VVLFEYKTLFSFFVKMVERDRSCLEKNKNCIYAKNEKYGMVIHIKVYCKEG